MAFLDYFRTKQKNSANLAKERLQIIVAHERSTREQPDYLPALQKDLIEVISKYVAISQDQVCVNLEKEGEYSVLELNITFPEEQAVS
ncbi:cell division topological specificity factor MinE [Gammaproteobacteria bacterium 45_16_T64]|nr:cell division topological specificity factor MinE [Gammaproteobacteria bacterium 45_16_T64]